MQLQKITTDTADNTLSNRYKQPGIDYRGIAVLVAIGIIGALLVWLFIWVINRVDCYLATSCTVTTYIFYGYNILLGLGLLISILFLAARLYQAIINSSFLRGMSMPIHRKDIRKNATDAYKVEYRLAESEMYRGLDALTNTAPAAKKETDSIVAAAFSDELPFSEVMK